MFRVPEHVSGAENGEERSGQKTGWAGAERRADIPENAWAGAEHGAGPWGPGAESRLNRPTAQRALTPNISSWFDKVTNEEVLRRVNEDRGKYRPIELYLANESSNHWPCTFAWNYWTQNEGINEMQREEF